MKWKTKHLLQKYIAMLPDGISYPAHYFIQRKFGELKKVDPVYDIEIGIKLINFMLAQKHSIQHKAIIEIGTGRRLNIALTLWLCGAGEIVTVDLNPYLKDELVSEDINFIINHRESVRTLFGSLRTNPDFESRFDNLLKLDYRLPRLLQLMNVRYIAPADAARLDLSDHSFDFQISRNVLEHIPAEDIEKILMEGKRLLKKDGLSVHLINYSDHSVYTDNSVSTINFLQFSEKEWNALAGNRYSYHNRLRMDDMLLLFEKAGFKILCNDVVPDPVAKELILSGFKLDEKFRDKDINALIASRSYLVAGNS